MSNHATLEAAAQDRKVRLAQLKSLKRKQPPDAHGNSAVDTAELYSRASRSPSPDVASSYLSGRNYDSTTHGPKLGFESNPADGQVTLEAQAKTLAENTRKQVEEEEKTDKPLDLLKLQPKKPNWDLKRDLQKKLAVLNVRTDNAIAKLVREKIQKAQKEAKAKQREDEQGEEIVGIDGAAFVQALHELEREEEQDEKMMEQEDYESE